MQREPTIPIAVWLPALIAGIVLAFCWARVPSPSQAAVPVVAESPRIPAAVETAVPVEPAPRPADDLPIAAAATSPRTEPEAPATPAPAAAPDGWSPLDALADSGFFSTPFGAAARADLILLRGASDRLLVSGDTCAPFMVVVAAPRDAAGEERLRELDRAWRLYAARFRAIVLEPAGFADGPGVAIVTLQEEEPSNGGAAARRAAGRRAVDALYATSGRQRPCEWALLGLLECAGREDAKSALLADVVAADVESALGLTTQAQAALVPEGPEMAKRDAACGAIAAWALGAAGADRHRRATFLELLKTPATTWPVQLDALHGELAARFGFGSLAELLAAWDRARR